MLRRNVFFAVLRLAHQIIEKKHVTTKQTNKEKTHTNNHTLSVVLLFVCVFLYGEEILSYEMKSK